MEPICFWGGLRQALLVPADCTWTAVLAGHCLQWDAWLRLHLGGERMAQEASLSADHCSIALITQQLTVTAGKAAWHVACVCAGHLNGDQLPQHCHTVK